MYKVFINEKKLSFSSETGNSDKDLKFQNTSTFEIAADLLNNTSTESVNIFSHDVKGVWQRFLEYYKTIEAAGGVVLNEKEEVLFIYRLGKWDLPKGKTEEGENMETTALREVEEECSIGSLQIQDFIDSTYHMYKDRSGIAILKIVHWYRMKHLGSMQPKPQRIEGITKAEWLPQSEIQEIVFPNTFQNIKLILEKSLDLK